MFNYIYQHFFTNKFSQIPKLKFPESLCRVCEHFTITHTKNHKNTIREDKDHRVPDNFEAHTTEKARQRLL